MPDMKRYERAETWITARKTLFAHRYPYAYVYINADDLTYSIAQDHNAASTLYQAMYGPTPLEGRYMLGIQLPTQGVCTSCGQITPSRSAGLGSTLVRMRAWFASIIHARR